MSEPIISDEDASLLARIEEALAGATSKVESVEETMRAGLAKESDDRRKQFYGLAVFTALLLLLFGLYAREQRNDNKRDRENSVALCEVTNDNKNMVDAILDTLVSNSVPREPPVEATPAELEQFEREEAARRAALQRSLASVAELLRPTDCSRF